MPIVFLEPPAEIEILITKEGTQIFEVCNTCLAEKGADENCQPSALFFIEELRKDGHIAAITDPGEVAFR
jgi:hypothetical protein